MAPNGASAFCIPTSNQRGSQQSVRGCCFANLLGRVAGMIWDRLPYAESRERKKIKADYPRLVGGRFNTQGSVFKRLVLDGCKMSHFLCPAFRLWKFTWRRYLGSVLHTGDPSRIQSPLQCRCPHPTVFSQAVSLGSVVQGRPVDWRQWLGSLWLPGSSRPTSHTFFSPITVHIQHISVLVQMSSQVVRPSCT